MLVGGTLAVVSRVCRGGCLVLPGWGAPVSEWGESGRVWRGWCPALVGWGVVRVRCWVLRGQPCPGPCVCACVHAWGARGW